MLKDDTSGCHSEAVSFLTIAFNCLCRLCLRPHGFVIVWRALWNPYKLIIVTGSSSGMLGRVMCPPSGGFMVVHTFLWVCFVEWLGGHFVCRLQKNMFNSDHWSLFVFRSTYYCATAATLIINSLFAAAAGSKKSERLEWTRCQEVFLKLYPSHPTSASCCQSPMQIESLAGRVQVNA